MSDKNRSCPQCNSMMDFRLGAFDCQRCGHSELEQQPVPKKTTSGPGFKSLEANESDSPIIGTVYKPIADSSGSGADTEDPLEKEKKVYFWIIVLSEVLPFLLLLLGGLVSGEAEVIFFVFVVGLMVGVKIFLVHWIIMGEEIWIKWLTLVVNIFWLIFLILIVIVGVDDFYANTSATSFGLESFENFIYDFFIRAYCALLAGWAGWFIYILYRDIDKLGGYSSRGESADLLSKEKRAYFGIHLLSGIAIAIVAITFAEDIPDLAFISNGLLVFSFLLTEAVQLGIIWFVLFGFFNWSKWCCGGCAGFTALAGLATALGVFGLNEVSTGVGEVIIGIIQLFLYTWLALLLWRDVRQKNS